MQLFRQEVLEGKRQKLDGAVILTSPPLFRLLTVCILIFVVVAVIFLSTTTYVRKERVRGILQPDAGVVKLQAPQSGIVEDLLVTEGQQVVAGDTLIRIRSEKHGLEALELYGLLVGQYEKQIENIKSQVTKQEEQYALLSSELQAEKRNKSLRLQQLLDRKQIFAERIEIKRNLVEQVNSLADTGYVSGFELQRERDALLALKQQASTLRSEELALKNEIAQIENKIARAPIEQSETLLELDARLEEAKSQLFRAQQQHIGVVRAPVDGTVSGLLIKKGKMVQADQPLLSMFPEGSHLQAIIYIPTSSAGFVEAGQSIHFRYEAFPYEKFGAFSGRILEISSNIILPSETDIPGQINQPSYRVLASLDEDQVLAYGRTFALRAGMTFEADVILEKRTVLQWLFSPIYSLKGQL